MKADSPANSHVSDGIVPDDIGLQVDHANVLSAIVASSDDAILSKTMNGIITSWNNAAQRMYGYSPAEAVGKSVQILIPEDRPDELENILDRLKQGERVDHFETVRRRKDGSLIDISLTVSPIRDRTGTIVGASAIARDITDTKRARDIRFFLASIVDSTQDAILSKDLDGRILSWNKGAERLYGYAESEVLGKSIALLMPDDRQNELQGILQRLRNGERVEHYETIRKRKDGTLIDISVTVSPVRNATGTIIAASAIGRDITEQKQKEQEKTRLFNELMRSLQEKNILLQEVHHRVKNNLQIISSLLDLRSRYIKDPLTLAAFRESVARVRAMALIHERLYQSENLDSIDLDPYLKSLFARLRQGYQTQHDIKMTVAGQCLQLPLSVALPLGLIFNELVTNSLKYAFPLPSDNPEICVRFARSGNRLHVVYQDNGVGLPDDVQVSTSDTFGFKIVKLLAEQLEGVVESRNENGAIFELSLEIPEM